MDGERMQYKIQTTKRTEEKKDEAQNEYYNHI